MNKKGFLSLVMAFTLVTLTTGSASATTWRLNPGYWQNPKLTVYDTSNYYNSVYSAVTGWNNLGTANYFYYYGASNPPAYHQVRVSSARFYDAAWVGATYVTLQNGEKKNPETATYANWDASIPYQFAWIDLNEQTITHVHNLGTDKKIAIAGHELGHSLAAGHDTSKTFIMYPDAKSVTSTYAAVNEKAQMVSKYGY
ncbi:hypothetical protein [Tumebacillus lipolyticus]|uniref:Peptidase M10 metallopeptidase domain-containing protein n=1 Tax=Tumebacillus lipolyticus TaxID=1280370 RepID=A0ABW5A069_9BACL